ncbi:MAG TPA: sodium/proline symporter PutP [Enteractinococcus helveticum]|uniref:Sodium/proline symporter n=1 Tax=Enteractinococcus helveticum TaxID=1837282 RepID=A0A921K8J8_9MICC|nr:sodium/proline symporter PutP [Enteractinococcus helveticum]HJF15683.1 sodium/proline symporter PutP [Enteractinococcus helveticum]
MSEEHAFQLAAIVVYLIGMLVIGYYAYRRTKTGRDFLLAGRDLSPRVAALSAGASDMSGWLLMGLPGALYATGLIEAWIAIGLTLGTWLNWMIVAPRLRVYSEITSDSITMPAFFEFRFRDRTRLIRSVSALIILVFFVFYVASMMVASGAFFESAFGWNYMTGVLVVGGVTLTYTAFGGFLGASLTDVAQGLLMLAALVSVPIIATVQLGGPGRVASLIDEADVQAGLDHLSFTGGGLSGASMLVIISGLAWGLGYFGQPHILARFFAIRSHADVKTARRIGTGWVILCMGGAVLTGLIGVAWFHDAGQPLDNPETVFLLLSQVLFHPFVAGLILAAVIAAIMSTMSSQLLVSASALVEDIYGLFKQSPGEKQQLWLGRLAVVAITIIAILIAQDPESTVLDLVGFAWAGFGAAFGPMILMSLYWKRVTAMGALAGMIAGAAVSYVWGTVPAIKEAINLYEIIPGVIAHFVVAIIVSLLTKNPDPEVAEEFEQMRETVSSK